MICIYALIDPDNNVRYIGKTKVSLQKRLSQHITDSKSIMNGSKRRNINKRYSWIISLLKDNKKPNIILLEECNENNWIEREVYYISKYKNLTNMTKGGDGGSTNKGRKFGPISEETRRKISENTKKGMMSEEVREKCRLGNKLSKNKIFLENGSLRPDIKVKISIGLKEYHKNKKPKNDYTT